jgi:serine phosphatase RsbU (regulator of sigma subunit)
MAEINVRTEEALTEEERFSLKVLVVDDDPFINRLVQIRLKNRGYQVISAGDGEKALELIRTVAPDLVFLDVAMPKVGGLQVLEEIRRDKLDVAVIMMTAFGSESIAVEAMRHGADDYLPKPFEPSAFEAVLERTVRRLLLTRQNVMLRRRLDLEMAQAAQVQADLLPQSVPQLEGFEVAAYFRSARAVSGDFYDWYQDGQTLAFTLGDVMGKGMPAALVMATARAVMRVAGGLRTPALALQTAAETLGPDLERSGRFVTLFHCQVEGTTRHFTYANAGHRLGFVRRASGALENFEAQALPLGILADDTYTEKRIELAPGDWVVIYSDGLIDAKGDEEIAVEELAVTLDGESHPASAIERLVALAVPPGELPDDLTVLVLRCNEEGA